MLANDEQTTLPTDAGSTSTPVCMYQFSMHLYTNFNCCLSILFPSNPNRTLLNCWIPQLLCPVDIFLPFFRQRVCFRLNPLPQTISNTHTNKEANTHTRPHIYKHRHIHTYTLAANYTQRCLGVQNIGIFALNTNSDERDRTKKHRRVYMELC